MEQRSITGQAFRVLTDAANGVFHRISMWTHADDVEMENGDSLTVAMDDKYNLATSGFVEIQSMNDVPENSVGVFIVSADVGTIMVENVALYAHDYYVYYSYSIDTKELRNRKAIFAIRLGGVESACLFTYMQGQWTAKNIAIVESDLYNLQKYLEREIGQLDRTKLTLNHVVNSNSADFIVNISDASDLDNIPENTAGFVMVLGTSNCAYYDKVANSTTIVNPGSYGYIKLGTGKIFLFGADPYGESDGTTDYASIYSRGGGYACSLTNGTWHITKLLTPWDFTSDASGIREQIVTGITCQIWPVGSIYINLTRQNPGEFLGGTWNLITEGILTAIKGSPEQTGYHQRDLYKAVKDEDRGEHLYGVFAWQRIA